jgi:hypothetical protein
MFFHSQTDRHGISLQKTAKTSTPKVLLIEMASPAQEQTETRSAPPVRIKLMKRDNSGDSGKQSRSSNKPSQQRGPKTIVERERQYAEARARIFGTPPQDEVAADTVKAEQNGSGADGRSVAHTDLPIAVAAPTASSIVAPSLTGSTPDEDAEDTLSREAAQCGPSFDSPQLQRKSAVGQGSRRAPRKKPVNPGEWTGEKKVVLRNKEAEKNDPDFRRNYSASSGGYRSTGYTPYGMIDPGMMQPQLAPSIQTWMGPQQPMVMQPFHPSVYHVGYLDQSYSAAYGHVGTMGQYDVQGQQLPQPSTNPSHAAYNQEFPPLG